MLKLKLGLEAPPGAAILTYVTGPSLSIKDHLSFQDRSFNTDENLTGMQFRTQIVELATDLLADADVVLYNRSLLDRFEKKPIPLPYKWRIGSNTALGRDTHLVFDPAVDAVGGSSAGQRANALMKKNFTVVNQHGDVSPDFKFEVVIVGETIAGSIIKYDVDLYANIQSDDVTQFRLRYNAVDAANQILYNTAESINTTPAVDYIVLDKNDAVPGGTSLSVVLADNNSITLVDQGGPAVPAINAMGLFSSKDGLIYFITGTELHILEGASIIKTITLAGKTVADVVQEINASVIPVEASLLAEGLDATDIGPIAVNTVIPEDGVRITLTSHYGVRYPNRAKIFVKRPPVHLDTNTAWYPRINTGKFRLDHDNGTNLYRIPEVATQVFSEVSGTGKFDELNELPVLIAPRQIQLRNNKMIPESIRLTIGTANRNNLISDYDVEASLLYLSDKTPSLPISVDYTYESTDLIYDRLNLNPVSAQNPEAGCQFYVIYMIPEEIERLGLPVENFTRTILHTNSENLQEALDQVVIDGTELVTGRTLYPIILNIIQVTSDLDITQVNVLDVRTRGGGISEIHIRQDESAYYVDIGHVDGEPFPADGPVVLEVPDSVLDTLVPALENADDLVEKRYNDSGGETVETVRGIARKYLAAGTFPLIKTYKR